ncbi:MAG: hypothetical protein ACOYK8_08795 [Alphaproteobacteria bacterium]
MSGYQTVLEGLIFSPFAQKREWFVGFPLGAVIHLFEDNPSIFVSDLLGPLDLTGVRMPIINMTKPPASAPLLRYENGLEMASDLVHRSPTARDLARDALVDFFFFSTMARQSILNAAHMVGDDSLNHDAAIQAVHNLNAGRLADLYLKFSQPGSYNKLHALFEGCQYDQIDGELINTPVDIANPQKRPIGYSIGRALILPRSLIEPLSFSIESAYVKELVDDIPLIDFPPEPALHSCRSAA